MENNFEYYIETNEFHFKYAKGEPMLKDQEFHDYSEFVFFMSGNSFLISKNIQQELAPGSIVLIPKENFHQFCISQPESYVRCILGFKETPELSGISVEIMNAIKVISNPDKRLVSVFDQLIEIAKSELPLDDKKLYVNSALVQLLVYLKLKPFEAVSDSGNLSPVVRQALGVIDEKYNEDLSVKSIAEILFVSPSTLAHKFTDELNISVYRYITKKRLSVAHDLICRGESLKTAASKVGFGDYSCFYRLYKKYYTN